MTDFKTKSIIDINDLTVDEINQILDLAKNMPKLIAKETPRTINWQGFV